MLLNLYCISAKKVDMANSKKTSTPVAFADIVGQDELKHALMSVVVNKSLDGLLIQGEKGTAKSTTVRALRAILPEQRVITECRYGCPPHRPSVQCADCQERINPTVESRPVPLITLPLGATRERVVGSLSVEAALEGESEFNPGLLAAANRGLLYIDEVNLLDDHLVDVILDAAASGENRVERDGVSVTHPASFTLIGTMNPEEGDLRPQLKDRFALQATVSGLEEIPDRVDVIEQVLQSDRETETETGTGISSSSSSSSNQTDTHPSDDATDTDSPAATRERIIRARELLPSVTLPSGFTTDIAELCRDAGVDGHRADIATARAAITFAALAGRTTVIEGDVRRAAELALPHRLQSTPFEDAPNPEDVLDEHLDDESGDTEDTADDADIDADTDADTADDADAQKESNSQGGRSQSAQSSNDDNSRGATESENDDNADIPDHPEDGADTDETQDGSSRSSPQSGGASSEKSTSAESDDADGDASNPSNEIESNQAGENNDESDTETATPRVPGQPSTETAVDPDESITRAPDITINAQNEHQNQSTDASNGGSQPGTADTTNRGARVRTEKAASTDSNVDAGASIRAAASRGADHVTSRDLRQSVRAGETSALVVFAVDASASMRGPMRTAKGVAIELLKDAYQQRDEVALIAFAGDDADVMLPPTDNVSLAARHLKELPTGDQTPLTAGIETTTEVLSRADPDTGIVVLVTDGRANAVGERPTAAVRSAATTLAAHNPHVVVVDAGSRSRATVTETIVSVTNGERIPLSALTAERVDAAVSTARGNK